MRPEPVPLEVIGALDARRQADAARRTTFGETRPIISTEFAEHRIVGVGNELHWSKRWKTFPDFLFYYIKRVFGSDWGNAELAKPFEERHTVLKWYAAVCEMQRRGKGDTGPDEHGIYETELDGPSRAYLLLAYDLYVLRHHSALQDVLVARLRHPEQFQGARYELFVAAAMIRAGFDLEFEDETDATRRHPEFVATFRSTGEQLAVEAKSRHRPGALGRPGDLETRHFKVGIGRLLRHAIRKRPDLPYLIFIDANMPPEIASPLGPVDWRAQVDATVLAVDPRVTDGGIIVGSTFAMLVVTNTPDHYGDEGRPAPGYLFYRKRPLTSVRPVSDPRLLDAVETALENANAFPQRFPGEDE